MLLCKLRVSHPRDSAEREAESVAAEVVNAPQHSANASNSSAERHPEAATEVVDQLRGVSSDAILPESVRNSMEPRFGADFSGVRIHNDSRANALAEALNANAFTVGREIFFGEGKFDPASETGRRLIAHELTHVVQQGAAAPLDGATLVAARSHFSVEPAIGNSEIFRQEQDLTENPAPMPEEATTEPQPTAPDQQDGEDGEMSLQVGYALPALNDLQAGRGFDTDIPVIQRQPKPPPAPAQPAQPAQPAPPAQPVPPATAAKPVPKVAVEPVKVLDPKVGPTKKGTDAETEFAIKPDFTFKKKGGKITSYGGSVSRNIWTTYQPGVEKKTNSAYGRGTTPEDKKAGNTSLEFHESRHAEDYKAYLDSHPLPEFTGKEGMTEAEFKDAVKKYGEELTKYSQAAREASEQSTDCVGTKEKSCK